MPKCGVDVSLFKDASLYSFTFYIYNAISVEQFLSLQAKYNLSHAVCTDLFLSNVFCWKGKLCIHRKLPSCLFPKFRNLPAVSRIKTCLHHIFPENKSSFLKSVIALKHYRIAYRNCCKLSVFTQNMPNGFWCK